MRKCVSRRLKMPPGITSSSFSMPRATNSWPVPRPGGHFGEHVKRPAGGGDRVAGVAEAGDHQVAAACVVGGLGAHVDVERGQRRPLQRVRAHTNVYCCSFVIFSMIAAGPCTKPSRQPVTP